MKLVQFNLVLRRRIKQCCIFTIFFGTFLTLSGINFQAMKCTLANVWHPVGGVAISDLGNDRFLFRFFYEVDANRILMNGPWTFNSHLILHRLKEGKDPLLVPLFWVDF